MPCQYFFVRSPAKTRRAEYSRSLGRIDPPTLNFGGLLVRTATAECCSSLWACRMPLTSAVISMIGLPTTKLALSESRKDVLSMFLVFASFCIFGLEQYSAVGAMSASQRVSLGTVLYEAIFPSMDVRVIHLLSLSLKGKFSNVCRKAATKTLAR